MNWQHHFQQISRGADFGSDFGIGVIDLLPPKPQPPPPPPSDVSGECDDLASLGMTPSPFKRMRRILDVGAEVSAPLDPHAAAALQRDSDRKKLVMVGMGAGALLLLAGLLSGPSSPSPTVIAAPAAPRPVVNVRFDKFFGGKRKK